MMRISTLSIVACLVLFTGCVERKLFIHSEPTDAEVWLNGRAAGKTPLEISFNYYGTRDVELRLKGHKAVHGHVEVPAPWYQYFPFDFFTDLLWPWTIQDEHEADFVLEPYTPEDLDPAARERILEHADALRYDEFIRYGEVDDW
jgi:hypothetical protein